MFSILRGFLPWILYSVLYGSNPDQYMLAISAALASSVIFDWKELKAGFILTRGTFFYFLLLLVLTAVFHWQWLQDNTWLISNCMLAGITFTSALIGKPFTLQYAKQQVREELWENAFFLQINYILTNIWGVIFLLTALVNYFHVEDPKINGLSYIILSNIGWFVGMYINKWFPDYWKARKFPKKAIEKNTAKAVSPFLEGNFAPYRSEGKFDSLEIVGKIPDDLNGVLLRNGPNPQFDPVGSYHWFNGDGMLHAIRINQGRASYDNKWVRTERFKLENKAGKGLHPSDLSAENEDDNGTANTNIIAYHEKLLALNEGASPVEIELKNLDTIGNYTFDGQMKRRHTAHPRIDHARQEFITYSYIGEDEKLFYYRFNKDNQLIVKKEILWPYAAMMHDFVTTENYVIFPIFPCTMSIQRMMNGENIFMWEGDKLKTFFIITDRLGNEIARIETDAYYVYHFGNAYEKGDDIIIDAMLGKCSGLMPDRHGKVGTKKDSDTRLARWKINLKSQSIDLKYLDDTGVEFPRFDERFNGRQYQHLYTSGCGSLSESQDRIMHYDLVNQSKQEHVFGNDVPSEPVFVPRSEKEGDGYLLVVVYRTNEDRSDVVILDAQNIAEKPIAIIKIPHRIPYGFHGNFI